MLFRCFLLLLLAVNIGAQSPATGALYLEVKDPAGAPLQATGRLSGVSNSVERVLQTDAQGKARVDGLPFGRYRLEVNKTGFAPQTLLLDIHSSTPLLRAVTMTVGTVAFNVEVVATTPLPGVELAAQEIPTPPTDYSAVQLFVQRAAQSQPATLFEPATVSDRTDGKIAHLAWNASRDPETGLVRAVGHDVTALRVAERDARAASERASAASRIKSQFLANMSHEIRTPMNGVLGMTALALDTQLTPEQREYLEAVQTSAESLLAIINDILDISKIEAGKLTIENIPFSLQRTLDTALVPLLSRAAQKNLVLEVAVAPGTPDDVLGDPLRLRQVLVNLVGNALKFTKEGGIFVCVSAGDGPDMLHFSVADTGVGIPPDRHGLVFQAFRQADDSTARNFGGTGLGLAICKELVQLMGGRIWVESEVGAGSQFHFDVHLPAAAVERAPDKSGEMPAVRAPALAKRLRVLVAEDNAVNTKLALRFLQKLDCDGVHVENGALAFEKVFEERFDVVLMDMQMPVLDGLDATRKIREREARDGGHVPIIALTANAMKGDSDAAFAAGMDGYLSKPLDIAALRQALSQIGKTEATPVPSSPFVMYAESDAKRALVSCGGEEDLFVEVIGEFRKDWPKVFDDLRAALEANNAYQVMRAAHRIKGALLAMGAGRGSHLAQLLEEAGRGGDVSQCGSLADALSRELAHCDEVLRAIAARLAPDVSAPALAASAE